MTSPSSSSAYLSETSPKKSWTQRAKRKQQSSQGKTNLDKGERKYDGLHAELTQAIIAAVIAVQRELGPGLLESGYEACLNHELSLSGHRVERQVSLSLSYRGLEVPQAFRIGMIVDGLVLIELKATGNLASERKAQVLRYRRFSGLPVGLLMNFKRTPLAQKGIRRFMNEHAFPSASSA
jgi:GxxExxY protein